MTFKVDVKVDMRESQSVFTNFCVREVDIMGCDHGVEFDDVIISA